MTLLNKEPIKARAKDFLTGKLKTVKVWYVLGGDKEVKTIRDYGYVLGLGGACILENKEGQIIASGYLGSTEDIILSNRAVNVDRRGL